MNYLTEYQLSEITLGSLYFMILYTIGSLILNGSLDLIDVLVTSVIFIFWYYLVKITTNYFTFINF
jgi:hypothetical protein